MEPTKSSNEYLNDLLKALSNSIVISDTFTTYVMQVATKSIEINFNNGKNGEYEDFTHYKKLLKELHTITIFSSNFQNLILGIIHDCIMSAYNHGSTLKD